MSSTRARDVAVDLLLVLVQQDHALALGDVGQRAHPDQDVVADVVGVLPLGGVEREDPDVSRVRGRERPDRTGEPCHLVLDGLADGHLADRRGDGRDGLPALVETPVESGELVLVEVDDVDAPGAAHLDVRSRRAPGAPPPARPGRRRSRRRSPRASRLSWSVMVSFRSDWRRVAGPPRASSPVLGCGLLDASGGQAADEVALEDRGRARRPARRRRARRPSSGRRPAARRPPGSRRTPAAPRRRSGCPGSVMIEENSTSFQPSRNAKIPETTMPGQDSGTTMRVRISPMTRRRRCGRPPRARAAGRAGR